MKKYLPAIMAVVCSSAMAAQAPLPQPVHEFKRNRVELSVVSISDSFSQTPLSEIEWGLKGYFQLQLTRLVYGAVNVEKLNYNHFNYGATVGGSRPVYHNEFKPYAEVYYEYHSGEDKNLTSKNLGYDVGCYSNYFKNFNPFVEMDNFAERDKFYVKTGALYNLNEKFFIKGDYSFPSKVEGTSGELGVGLVF